MQIGNKHEIDIMIQNDGLPTLKYLIYF